MTEWPSIKSLSFLNIVRNATQPLFINVIRCYFTHSAALCLYRIVCALVCGFLKWVLTGARISHIPESKSYCVRFRNQILCASFDKSCCTNLLHCPDADCIIGALALFWKLVHWQIWRAILLHWCHVHFRIYREKIAIPKFSQTASSLHLLVASLICRNPCNNHSCLHAIS